jgi:hypothetical protein
MCFARKLWINTKTKCETGVSDISKPKVINPGIGEIQFIHRKQVNRV